MQTVRSRAKNSRYAHSNGAFPRDERILFNDIKTYLKCKLQGQLQMAVFYVFLIYELCISTSRFSIVVFDVLLIVYDMFNN